MLNMFYLLEFPLTVMTVWFTHTLVWFDTCRYMLVYLIERMIYNNIQWYTMVYNGIQWYTVGIQLVYSWYTVGIWYTFGIQLVYSWYTVGIQLVYNGIQWYTMVYQYMIVFINVTNNDLIMLSVNHIDLRRIMY